MKDCKDCEFFNGWDYSDGTPHCDYCDGENKGYEYCPYNDMANTKRNGMKIEIDAEFMEGYILHTLKNTIENQAYSVAVSEIKTIITDKLKEKIIDEMEKQISSVVSNEISDFMSKDITVGGGWSEPQRTLTRAQYLSEMVEKEMSKGFTESAIKEYTAKSAKNAIDSFESKLRSDINSGVKAYFDSATRQTLTENVVSMLMCNDTYKKLSESMQTFLPTK